ncbi:isoprenoid synthase domain-containing protein [Mycena filopes]|nr:isoprenoid synthase domain-containing protein [Mycena filopes]
MLTLLNYIHRAKRLLIDVGSRLSVWLAGVVHLCRARSSPLNYTDGVRRLLTDIGYRHDVPPRDSNYWGSLHGWVLETLGPASTCSLNLLNDLEQSAGSLIEIAYPCASTQLKLILAKLTVIAIFIDDSTDDEAVHTAILRFSHCLYLGTRQENGVLALYHATMKEMCEVCEDDPVLRGLSIRPWINHIDACLMERVLVTARTSTSTGDLGRPSTLDSDAPKFPDYLRYKSAIGEAYAAWMFKATKEQKLPMIKYIQVLPDATFFVEAVNDILSFYKEELAGETHNLIHLRTRSLSSSGARGSGADGEWTPHDTLMLLCDEVKAATFRIDRVLRLDECERKMRGEEVDDIDEVDVAIAKQWRGFRDGYISWHLDCRRYKLGFLRALILGEEDR